MHRHMYVRIAPQSVKGKVGRGSESRESGTGVRVGESGTGE